MGWDSGFVAGAIGVRKGVREAGIVSDGRDS